MAAFILAGVFYFSNDRRLAVEIILSTLTLWIMVEIIKLLSDRARPFRAMEGVFEKRARMIKGLAGGTFFDSDFGGLSRKDLKLCLHIMMTWYRDILVAKAAPGAASGFINIDSADEILAAAKSASLERLDAILKQIIATGSFIEQNVNPKLAMSTLGLMVYGAYMYEVIQVRLREAGKISYFSTSGMKFKVGDYVIVEADRGLDYGQVLSETEAILDADLSKRRMPFHRNTAASPRPWGIATSGWVSLIRRTPPWIKSLKPPMSWMCIVGGGRCRGGTIYPRVLLPCEPF